MDNKKFLRKSDRVLQESITYPGNSTAAQHIPTKGLQVNVWLLNYFRHLDFVLRVSA